MKSDAIFTSPHALPMWLLCFCLIGLAIAAGLVLENRSAFGSRFNGVSHAAPAAATPTNFPCDLPLAEGERSIAAVDFRGGAYHLTCSATRPFITKKGGK